MGNDGGSIPRRIELVKEAVRKPNTSELKATLLEAQTHAWKICPLSNQLLTTPIVSDSSGVLYNKDAVLKRLLQKDNEKVDINAFQERISSLKDVVEVHFKVVKEGEEEKRICPITSKELGPGTRAVYLVPCGHAFSEVAIREVNDDRCIECNKEYATENIINILPTTSDELAKLSMRIINLRQSGISHSLKKITGGKKRKKSSGVANATEIKTGNSSAPTLFGIKNAATASLTSKVLEEQEERNKRRNMGMNENLKSLFSSKGNAMDTYKSDYMTRGFSLPIKKM